VIFFDFPSPVASSGLSSRFHRDFDFPHHHPSSHRATGPRAADCVSIMPDVTLATLKNTLLRLRLATQYDLDAAQAEVSTPSPEALLHVLERNSVLTPYQATKLAKGDTEGLVLGHFKLMYRNAAGSFARVFRACDLRTGEMTGLKLLRSRHSRDPAAVQQFKREAELGKTLRHENIVPIYEIGETDGQHYFTMEFVEGGNLLELMKARKKMSLREATRCLIDVTEGLHYAHSRGLMHRDLKLSNVLMSSTGHAKLVDFGLADAHQAREKTGSDGTQRTLDYATLEKNTNAPRDDPRTDLFFLGAIYYELLTGEAPLPRTKDRDARGDFARYRQIVPLRQHLPEAPRRLTDIVDRLLQLSPAQRYQTTGELLADLKGVYEMLPAEAAGFASASSPRGEGSRRPSEPAPEHPTSPPDAKAASPRSSQSAADVLLCVESRLKQQDMLRQYFSKHTYRVLMLSDPERALLRLATTRPDAVILVAETFGEEVLEQFAKFQKACGEPGQACLLVLSVKQADWLAKVKESPRSRVLVQPVTLRDLRKVVKSIRKGEFSTSIESPTDPMHTPPVEDAEEED
jgi:serine/threonine protein kinase